MLDEIQKQHEFDLFNYHMNYIIKQRPIEPSELASVSSHLSFAIKQKSANGRGGSNFFEVKCFLRFFFMFSISFSSRVSGSNGNGSEYDDIGTSAIKGQYSPSAISFGSVSDESDESDSTWMDIY